MEPAQAQHWCQLSIIFFPLEDFQQCCHLELSLYSSLQREVRELSQVSSGCSSLARKTITPNWEELAGCVWGARPLHFNHSSTAQAGMLLHPHPRHSCQEPQQVKFKQRRNDGWQQARPETGRKLTHGAKKVLWHSREGGHIGGH